ncbi:MAG TPA: C40 family peptidase [Pyrinomonadaceae bacterium]|nr:C40 family peptidase [Pyrinomonadaceae bacterium]
MNFKKVLSLSLFFSLFSVISAGNALSQGRERIVQTVQSSADQPAADLLEINEQKVLPKIYKKPETILTNKIIVASIAQPLVKKTASSQPTNAPINNVNKNSYSAFFSHRLSNAIQSKLGIPYLYGSDGPTRYDCSGLVWSVFQEAGFSFERTSARNIWYASEPVQGAERYKFGTLVFFKGLGHMGIVADEHGFYHASSSKGVTYSRFDGYWKNHLVGFRRLKMENMVASLK